MKTTKLLFFVFMLTIQSKAFCQIGKLTLNEYQLIQNEQSKYYDSLKSNKENLKGLGYKDFERHKIFYDQAYQNDNGPVNYYKRRGQALTELRQKYLSGSNSSNKTSNVQERHRLTRQMAFGGRQIKGKPGNIWIRLIIC